MSETHLILAMLPVFIFFWFWASLLSKRMQWLEDREFKIIQMLDVVLENQYDEQDLQDDDEEPDGCFEDLAGECPECAGDVRKYNDGRILCLDCRTDLAERLAD